MKTSECHRITIGCNINDRLIDRTSYVLIKALASLPPSKVTLVDGNIYATINRDDITNPLFGSTGRYQIISDHKCSSFYTTQQSDEFKYSVKLCDTKNRNRASIASVYSTTSKDNHFTIYRNTKVESVEVSSLEVLIEFCYNNSNVKIEGKEVWLSPLRDNDSLELYFTNPPYYTIDIYVDRYPDEDFLDGLLTHIIPGFIKNRNDS